MSSDDRARLVETESSTPDNYGEVYVVVFCRCTNPLSVVVVVVELDVSGAGVTTVVDGGAASTTGAGFSSTFLWYEKHPVTIPHAAMAAGIIAIRLIILISFEPSIGDLPL